MIEEKTQKKALYEEVNEGDYYKVSFGDDINSFFNAITPNDYIKTLAEKYI